MCMTPVENLREGEQSINLTSGARGLRLSRRWSKQRLTLQADCLQIASSTD